MAEATIGAGPAEGARAPVSDLLAEAKTILRVTSVGSLATIEPDGWPLATLVTVATDLDGAPILLTSALSAHSRNMLADPRVAVLLAPGGKGDALAHPRLTVCGRAERASGEARSRLRRRFLARHPKASLYADFADFAFWRVDPTRGHFNGGFAKAAAFDGAELRTALDGADELVAAEASAIEHLNADHADALDLYARVFGGAEGGRWRAVALDPEGLDVSSGDRAIRILFPERVESGDRLRAVLVDLARQARARASAAGETA